MKYVVAIWLVVSSMAVRAQMVCRVYQQFEGMESKRCVLTRTYDEEGRPVQERVNGYAVCLDDPNTMYCCKEDGLYDYHYDDTSLYKIVMTDFDDVTRRPIDSSKIFYHYDSTTGVLSDELAVKHLNIRRPGEKPGGYRNTTRYVYNDEGAVMLKQDACGKNTAEYLTYDEQGRVSSDSISYFHDGFCMVNRYEYTEDGYRKYSWTNERKYPEVTLYKTDAEGRILEKSNLFHKNEEKDGEQRVRSFRWGAYMGKDLKDFRQFDKTTTRYDGQGRISEMHYYYQGRHTTTHRFEYESGVAKG